MRAAARFCNPGVHEQGHRHQQFDDEGDLGEVTAHAPGVAGPTLALPGMIHNYLILTPCLTCCRMTEQMGSGEGGDESPPEEGAAAHGEESEGEGLGPGPAEDPNAYDPDLIPGIETGEDVIEFYGKYGQDRWVRPPTLRVLALWAWHAEAESVMVCIQGCACVSGQVWVSCRW